MRLRPIFLSLVASCAPHTSPDATSQKIARPLERDSEEAGRETRDAEARGAASIAVEVEARGAFPDAGMEAGAPPRSMPSADAFPRVSGLGKGTLQHFRATFLALRESGNQRASFGGARGEAVDGLIGPVLGGGCESAVAQLKKGFNSGRKVLACRGGTLAALDRYWEGGTVAAIGDSSFMKAVTTIQSPEVAVLFAWVSGYFKTAEVRAGVPVRKTPGGFELLATTFDGCAGEILGRAWIEISPTGLITVLAADPSPARGELHCMPLGRRPEGFAWKGEAHDLRDLDGYCARAEALEAASVPAFGRLAEELAVFGAPEALVLEARRAQGDERRHARTMRRLQRRPLGRLDPLDPSRLPFEERPLAAMLEENALEGCVLETYAALLATYQSVHATENAFRRAMRGISREEARHAELAWSVHAWGMPLVSVKHRREIRRLQEAKVVELLRGDSICVASLRRQVGEPSRAVHRLLVAALAERLGLSPRGRDAKRDAMRHARGDLSHLG